MLRHKQGPTGNENSTNRKLSYLGLHIRQSTDAVGAVQAADASALVERTTGLDPVISDMASRRSSRLSYVRVDPGRGLEPRFSASKAALLPLETSPESTSWFGAKDSNPPLLGQSQPCYLTTPAPSKLNGGRDENRTRLIPLDRRVSTPADPAATPLFIASPIRLTRCCRRTKGLASARPFVERLVQRGVLVNRSSTRSSGGPGYLHGAKARADRPFGRWSADWRT